MIKFSSSGNTNRTEDFLRKMRTGNFNTGVAQAAQQGVDALRQATPLESGITADSWSYEIVEENGRTTIWWVNTHEVNGFNVAIGLQYGHGTGQGGWVEGYDYINPALKPIFDALAEKTWKEVQNA